MTDILPFIAGALHLLWVAAAFFAFMSWRRLRELGATPPAKMTQVRSGMEARVQGRLAFDGAARTSPLGNEAAVWFDWKVERHDAEHRDPGPTGHWITQAVGSSAEPFALLDEAGNRMLVWPDKAEVLDVPEQTWDGEYPDTIDGTLRDRLLRGVGLGARLTDASVLHFTERWLPPGALCFVTGRVEAPGPEHGPDMRGLIREGGDRAFLIVAGVLVDAQARLRRKTIRAAFVALAACVLAVLASIRA
jgi:hypothetical protein